MMTSIAYKKSYYYCTLLVTTTVAPLIFPKTRLPTNPPHSNPNSKPYCGMDKHALINDKSHRLRKLISPDAHRRVNPQSELIRAKDKALCQ